MSVGHVARVLEENGIATVIIAVEAFRVKLEAMSVPRLFCTPYLMGRPLGHPGDDITHERIVREALMLLEQI
ncbi:MAG: hypothetical protein K8I82_25450 [Anaerolineae bacterium]|nr:hypothetical protein [Anaerolineae bacterium]